MKKLGAILLHDSVWVLPARPALVEHFRWLAAEIRESAGEALVWVAQQGLPDQDDALIEQFHTQAESDYLAILAALDASKSGEKNDAHAERAALARRYQQIHARDYFHAPTGDLVRARLEATSPHPDTDKGGSERHERRRSMKWVTWTGVGIDRMACAWLIRRRIDPDAQFLFIPEGSAALPPTPRPSTFLARGSRTTRADVPSRHSSRPMT